MSARPGAAPRRCAASAPPVGWRLCAARVSVPPPGAALSVGVAPALLLLCLGLWFVYFGVGWSPCCCDRWRSCSGIWDCSWVVYFTLYRALARCTPHSHTRNQKQGPRRKIIRLYFFLRLYTCRRAVFPSAGCLPVCVSPSASQYSHRRVTQKYRHTFAHKSYTYVCLCIICIYYVY